MLIQTGIRTLTSEEEARLVLEFYIGWVVASFDTHKMEGHDLASDKELALLGIKEASNLHNVWLSRWIISSIRSFSTIPDILWCFVFNLVREHSNCQ